MKNENRIFIVIVLFLSIIMSIFMHQKEGFHEDEMFSYGSSNYKYDNVYQQFGKSDFVNTFIEKYVLKDNLVETFKNWKYYYIDHTDERDEIMNEIHQSNEPVWRSKEEAKEYLTIQKGDVFNYAMVYYNQYRDIHPPLFYYLVHTVSIFFIGTFSKYIIFIINIIFFIASCYMLKMIMKVLNKEHLANVLVLFYGLSMGAISTVIFQRMYMMLTFFILWNLYINLKIIKNNYEIDKKTWILLTASIICGFLTQYNFCIFAIVTAFIIFMGIIKKKDKKLIIRYIANYIKIAILGVILFPVCIEKIFFSYRGISSFKDNLNYFDKLKQYIDLISYSFSIKLSIAVLGLMILSILVIYKLYKQKNVKIGTILLLIVPSLLYLLVIPKSAPNMEYKYAIRYIMCILPIISICIVLMLDKICKNRRQSILLVTVLTIILSIYGFISSEPKYLFRGYNQYLEIAEKYKNDNFVFIGNTTFNQVQNMQEFMRYKESLILNENQLDYLSNNEKLNESNEFILSIKKYLGEEYLLKEVMNKSGYSNYEVLLDYNGDVGCAIYKITK